MKATSKRLALRVSGIYMAVSLAWIAFSDRIVAFVAHDAWDLSWFQTAKGMFFVVSTGVLLYFFSMRQFQLIIESHEEKERETLAALREKEALLHEINHRVKNNLQVIVSLLSLAGCDDSRWVGVREKVRSMALAEELLYNSPNMSSVRAREYVESLALSIGGAMGGALTIRASAGDDAEMSAEVVIAVGIFMVEACSNSESHARRPDGKAVTVAMDIRREDGSIVATVRDDGPGFPSEGMKPGFGMELMDAIAGQVSGAVSWRNEGGAVVELRVPAMPSS